MSRTRVRRRRLAVLVMGAVVGGFWVGPVAQALGGSAEPVPVAARSYVVRSGDTLWSIAGRVAPGRDPRPVVDAIAAANQVGPGAIVPGQTLLIPLAG
ncbi:MAG: LysM peptidoglycan-binding domain-containing protein [Actinomycetota bacterium]